MSRPSWTRCVRRPRRKRTMAEVNCVRCGKTGPQLPRAPFRTPLGERIHEGICGDCWGEWLRYQTALINHYGLDVRDAQAREFLTANTEAFLFRTDGTK